MTTAELSTRRTRAPRRKIGLAIVAVVAAIATLLFLNNSSMLAERQRGGLFLLAHRGVAQRFDTTDLRSDTCTAARMRPPRHRFLENTLPSMHAAFALGADMVELDIHPTRDGQFVVFHDWTVDCRTNGHGVTREHSLAELKALDIGYGYTADGGRTYPFRGTGYGMMPSLDEVLATFPAEELLINVKSADPNEGAMLADYLARLPARRRDSLMVYGAEPPLAALRARLPGIRAMSRASLQRCILKYVAYGWSGHVPAKCGGTLVILPINIAPWMWGWPNRFLNRMESVGSRVFVQGPYSGGWSTGIDSLDDLRRLPAGYAGGVLTDEIAVIGPALGRSRPLTE